jgi:hypothetical protein
LHWLELAQCSLLPPRQSPRPGLGPGVEGPVTAAVVLWTPWTYLDRPSAGPLRAFLLYPGNAPNTAPTALVYPGIADRLSG